VSKLFEQQERIYLEKKEKKSMPSFDLNISQITPHQSNEDTTTENHKIITEVISLVFCTIICTFTCDSIFIHLK